MGIYVCVYSHYAYIKLKEYIHNVMYIQCSCTHSITTKTMFKNLSIMLLSLDKYVPMYITQENL